MIYLVDQYNRQSSKKFSSNHEGALVRTFDEISASMLVSDNAVYVRYIDDVEKFVYDVDAEQFVLTSDNIRKLVNALVCTVIFVVLDQNPVSVRGLWRELHRKMHLLVSKTRYSPNRILMLGPRNLPQIVQDSFVTVPQRFGSDQTGLQKAIEYYSDAKLVFGESLDFINENKNRDDVSGKTLLGHFIRERWEEMFKRFENWEYRKYRDAAQLLFTPYRFSSTVYASQPKILSELIPHEPFLKAVKSIEIEKLKSFYIYPIEMNATAYSRDPHDEKIKPIILPQKLINDVHNNKAMIAVYFSLEGYITHDRYERHVRFLLSRAGINPDLWNTNVIYFHGNHNERIRAIPGYVSNPYHFTTWVSSLLDLYPLPLRFEKDQYLYAFYSRRERQHRVKFIIETLSRGMENLAAISLGPDYTGQKFELSAKQFARIKHCFGTSPDNINHDVENPVDSIDSDLLKRTFLSVVGETLIFRSELFLSEKIFKPIAIGQPFIVFGNPGTLALLHEMGFRTFDKWWDESYDEMGNLDHRISAIHDILETLSEKTWEQLLRMRDEMHSVLRHNHCRLRDLLQDQYQSMNKWQPEIEYMHKVFMEESIKRGEI